MGDLAALVTLHRSLLADDRFIERLVSEQPATQLDPNTGKLDEDPANKLGPNMTARFQRYLGHPEGYGESFPWSKAVWLVGSWCRRNHPHHRGPSDNWRGSLCRQAIRLVIDIGWSPEHAARVLKAPELDMVLETALAQVERFMDESRAKAEERERGAVRRVDFVLSQELQDPVNCLLAMRSMNQRLHRSTARSTVCTLPSARTRCVGRGGRRRTFERTLTLDSV